MAGISAEIGIKMDIEQMLIGLSSRIESHREKSRQHAAIADNLHAEKSTLEVILHTYEAKKKDEAGED